MTYWQHRAEKDEALLAAANKTATSTTGALSELRGIRQSIDHPPPPAPQQSAASRLRGRGAFMPMPHS